MDDTKHILLRIFAVVAVLLVIYNLFTGAIVKEISIPEIFEIKFDTSNVTPILNLDSSPSAKIKDVWTEHNIFDNDVKGMIVHVNFEINNFQDNRGDVTAYFYNKDGEPFPANKSYSKYSTTEGQVVAGKLIRPAYKNTVYEDFQIFVPYAAFSAGSGIHEIKFIVIIKDDQEVNEFARSNWSTFSIER